MICLPLPILIAMRFSRGCRKSGIISLISVVSAIGIALGVAVLIVGLSAINGFDRELKNRILAVVPHGEIEAVNQPFQDWHSILECIEKVPGILGAAPYVNFTGLMENGTQLQAVHFRGINPKQESQISALSKFVQSDAWGNFKSGEQQVLLGKGVADALNIQRGAYVTVTIANRDPKLKLIQAKRIRLHVTGILQLSGQLDHNLAILPLSDAQQYLNIGDRITGVAIKVDQIFAVNKLVREAGEATHAYVYIKSWINTYGYIYRDIQMIRTIMYLAMVLVIAIASFNIVSTLVMALKDKSSDIAILRTMGAKDSLIRTIFIWYGLLTGLAGSIIGVAVGVVASLQLTTFIKWIEKLIGHSFLSGDIYFIDFLPSELHRVDVAIVIAIALILSLIASFYPAYYARRMAPASVLSKK